MGGHSLIVGEFSQTARVFDPNLKILKEVSLLAPRRRVAWLPLWLPFNRKVDPAAAFRELAREVVALNGGPS